MAAAVIEVPTRELVRHLFDQLSPEEQTELIFLSASYRTAEQQSREASDRWIVHKLRRLLHGAKLTDVSGTFHAVELTFASGWDLDRFCEKHAQRLPALALARR